MNEAARLNVGIDANLSGFERGLKKLVGLLGYTEAAARKAGQNIDRNLGDRLNKTTTEAGQHVEALKVKLDQLTAKRDLTIDTGAISKLNREIRETEAQMKRLKNIGLPTAPDGSLAGLKAQLNDLNRKRVLLVDTRDIARANREVVALKQQINKLDRVGLSGPAVGGGRGGMGGSLMSMVGGSGGAYGTAAVAAAAAVYASGKAILSNAATYERLNLKLQATTKSQAEFTQVQSYTQRLADRYGLSVKSVAEGYANLREASRGTTLEGRETNRIFQAITANSARFNLTGQQTEGVLRAIGQMMSKGKISAEEMTQQLGDSGLVGATNTMARALGISTGELMKLMASGELAATSVLPKFSTELLKTAAGAEKNATSMTGGYQRMVNQSELFLAEFVKTSGIDSFFGKLTGGMADYIAQLRQAKKETGSYFGDVQPDVLGGGKREAFEGLDQYQRQRVFNLNRRAIRANEAQQNALVNGPKFASEETRLELERLGAERKNLERRQRAFQQIARADTSPVGGSTKAVVNYAENFQRLEKSYDALIDKQKGLHSIGQELTKEEFKKLGVMERQLALGDPKKYGEKGTKMSTGRANPMTWVQQLEGMKKRLEDTVQSFSSKNVHFLNPVELARFNQAKEQLGAINAKLEETKALVERIPWPDVESALKVLKQSASSFDPDRINAIANNAKTSGRALPGAAEFLIGLGEQTRTRKADQKAAMVKMLSDYNDLPGLFKKLFTSVSAGARELDAGIVNGMVQTETVLSQKAKSFSKLLSGLSEIGENFATNQLPQFGSQFFAGLADSLNSGKSAPLTDALKGIKNQLADYMIQLGTMLTVTGGLEMLGVAIPIIGPGLALSGGQKLAVGGAMLAGGVAIRATGGQNKGYATGGYVLGAGSGTSDSIPAWLSNGEYVLKAAAVQKLGVPFLNGLNSGHQPAFASGGAVGRFPTPQLRYVAPPAPQMNVALDSLAGLATKNGRNTVSRQQLTTQIRGADLEIVQVRNESNRRAFG